MNAQPCPAWRATATAAFAHAVARSASSSTMNADLPPNSRNTFLTVCAAAAITALPVTVDPVNETRSTRGSPASCAPTPVIAGCDDVEHAGRYVGLLRDDPAEFRGAPGRIGRGLEDDGVACRHRRPDLGQVDLVREVPRRDGADDTERLSHDRSTARDAERCGDTEIGCPGVVLRGARRELQIVDGYLQLTAVGQGDRRADLGDGDVAQQLDLRVQRIAQLAKAMHPERGVPAASRTRRTRRGPPRWRGPCRWRRRRRRCRAAPPSPG